MTAAKGTLLIFFLVATGILVLPRGDFRQQRSEALSTLSLSLPGWMARPGTLTQDQNMLGYGVSRLYDSALLTTMVSPSGLVVEVQVFYCATRRPRNRLTSTSNRINCLHGHYNRVLFEAAFLSPELTVPRLRLARSDHYSTVNTWLQSQGKTSDTGWKHLFWLYWQDLTLARTDGCFIKVAYYGFPDQAKDEELDQLSTHLHRELDAWLIEQGR